MLTSVRLIFLPEYNGLFQILPYLQLNSLDKENDHQRQTSHVSVELHQYCDVINWIAKPDEEDWQMWTIACCSEHPNVDTLGFPRWQKYCPNWSGGFLCTKFGRNFWNFACWGEFPAGIPHCTLESLSLWATLIAVDFMETCVCYFMNLLSVQRND